ncbi:MAG: GNAT family N-acetyltransferase [Psychrobium sp.]|nr:GNAT family N-acetyltransferase [Psychrobium sp.]
MNISLHSASNKDKGCFYDLYCRAMKEHISGIWGWDENWQLNDFDTRFSDCTNLMIVLDDCNVGYVQITLSANNAYIMMFIIDEKYRSMNCGANVLQTLFQTFNCDSIELRIFKRNSRAKAFYLKNNFNVITTESDFYLLKSLNKPEINTKAIGHMITKLENSNLDVAKQIYTIFQCSYKIEAQLIGVTNFPPLQRSAQDIARSKSEFYGFSDNDHLAAIIEIVIEDKQLHINSLTVDPAFFRKGIADKLIRYVLALVELYKATVETAVVNQPAIKLYNKHGFVEFKRWTPSHGIEKLALSVQYGV